MKVEIKSVEELSKQKTFLLYWEFQKVQTLSIESCSTLADAIIELAEQMKKTQKMSYVVVDYNGDDDKFVLELKK